MTQSYAKGAAAAFGLMGMAYAIRRMTGIEDSPHTPCSYCGAGVEHFGTGCPVCNMFRKWDGWPAADPDRFRRPMTFYLLAPAGLEGPYATVEEARAADRGRGLSVAESVPPADDGTFVRVVGLRVVEEGSPT
jgi:hypothetical protein